VASELVIVYMKDKGDIVEDSNIRDNNINDISNIGYKDLEFISGDYNSIGIR